MAVSTSNESTTATVGDAAIRPFRIDVPQEEVDELGRRVRATRWPDKDIQFAHIRSRHDDALPPLVTHGWPGSIIEFLKVIGIGAAQVVQGLVAGFVYCCGRGLAVGCGMSLCERSSAWRS